MDYYLAWGEEDYNELLKRGALDAKLKTDQLSIFLKNRNLVSGNKIEEIIERINKLKLSGLNDSIVN
jgi:hypothetical protein